MVEGLTLSKKEGHTIFYGSVDRTLWVYDVDVGTLKIACTNLLGETEALEITPEDTLLVGTHNAPFGLHAFHVPTCQVMITEETLNNPFKFKDVEGIAVPVEACGK